MAENGNIYAQKLDEAMKKATDNWFNSLSKPELLQFLLDRDDITVDNLRDMLKHENVVLSFGVQFGVADGKTVADFGAAGK